MQLISQTDMDSTLACGHRLVVNLISRPGHTAQVRSCEVIGSQHRNRFTFPSQVSLNKVFVDEMARAVAQCLSSLSDTTEVVSLPTLSIEIPGLSLAKAHLITTKGEDGTVAIILRFKMMLGSVARAFRPELGIEDSVNDHSAHMSALVLSDIVMPLLNLCVVAESGAIKDADACRAFMDTLIDRAREVRFQAELIKRFVAFADKPATRARISAPALRAELAAPI